MKKLLLVLSLCTLLPVLGTSQGLVNVGKTAAKSAVTTPKVPTVSVRPPIAPRVPQYLGTVPHALGTTVDQAVLRTVEATAPQVTTPTLSARAAKEQQVAQLLGEQAQLQAQLQLNSFQTGIGRSVLFAPLMSSAELGYSVTVFKTSYNGAQEIYGVMPAHALPYDWMHGKDSVGKNFTVHVKQADGSELALDAQVVQVSAESMLALSLVKFSPQAEAYLSPLELADEPAAMGELLFSYGYAAGRPTAISRTVNAQSFVSVRTNQAIEGDREGFCGSPLLDANGQIKAIHTGTVEGNGKRDDVSYGTHVGFIRKLVEAYHNGGTSSFGLILDGQHVTDLNVDEYISAFYLYNEAGKKVAQQNLGKFSQSTLLSAIQEHPEAAYLQLTSRKAQWIQEGGLDILKEDRSGRDKTKHQHWYNLQTRQIEPVRPAVIKQ